MKSIVINFNFIIVAAVILTTLTLTNHAIGANQGTGEPLSLNLNLENCEGINSFNFGSVNNSTMDQITEKYGPIRVCYPNADVLAFTQYPSPADPNIIIIPSNEKNEGSGYATNGKPIFIIALKNGREQHVGKTRSEVFQALANGIEIFKGSSPEELELLNTAKPVNPGQAGLE